MFYTSVVLLGRAETSPITTSCALWLNCVRYYLEAVLQLFAMAARGHHTSPATKLAGLNMILEHCLPILILEEQNLVTLVS